VDIEVLTSFRDVEGEDDSETGDRLTGDVEGEDESETGGRLTRADSEGTGCYIFELGPSKRIFRDSNPDLRCVTITLNTLGSIDNTPPNPIASHA
jgi:hypothetical protein